MRRLPVLLIMLLSLGGAAACAHASDCGDCHKCDRPTAADPCLTACTRFLPDYSQENLPQTVVLDQLVEHYEAVVFDHKMHAEMSCMGAGSCQLCHHDTESHEIGRCSDCHEQEADAGKPGVLDLKAAYHRQCMFCHRDWSHETDCVICHAPLGGAGSKVATDAPLDETHAFARINLPDIVHFETDHKPAPYVTFNHSTHTDYGLSCQECHSKDDCASCHDRNRNLSGGKGHLHDFSDHSTCSQCHQMNQCGVCHARQADRPFTHALTGWPIQSYHQDLACARCHGGRQAHGALPRECDGCHAHWEQGSFDHAAIIGVDLGEDHEDLDCSDCHQDAGYTAPPVCSDCHEDERDPDLLR